MGADGGPAGSVDSVSAEARRVTVRRLCADDVAAVRPFDGTISRRFSPGVLAAYVADGCSVVAVLDDRMVGYLLARPLAYEDDRPLSVWVDVVEVHPEWRRRGIAGNLYGALGRWARSSGVRAVLTRVNGDDHAALLLHRSLGFEPHANDALIWRLDGA